MVCDTSRHDLTHVLHCEDREFLLCVHTDHTVAQSTHGQHRFPWRRNVHLWRSAGQRFSLVTFFTCLSTGQTHVCTCSVCSYKHFQRLQEWCKVKRDRSRFFTQGAVKVYYLRMATVIASEELAHGQITSGRSPRAWNTLRKASQDDIDPADTQAQTRAHTHAHAHAQTNKKTKESNRWWSLVASGYFLSLDENQQVHSHGLAPSATMSMRSEPRLMSLCSRWARRDQCMSLDLTTATRAV